MYGCCYVFFFNGTPTTEIYTFPYTTLFRSPMIGMRSRWASRTAIVSVLRSITNTASGTRCMFLRSEEHTSELQSQSNLVCRLLLEKKKTYYHRTRTRAHAHRSSVRHCTPPR